MSTFHALNLPLWCWFGVITITVVLPASTVHAQTASPSIEVQLRTMIAEVERLLTLLSTPDLLPVSHENTEVPVYSVTPSKYYSGPYTGLYTVEGKSISSLEQTSIPKLHKELWELTKDIFGPEAIANYITEFRIYHDRRADYDAFIDRLTDDEWIIGINSETVFLDSELDMAETKRLLVHEYAHLMDYYHSDVGEQYKQEFWTPVSRNSDYFVTQYAEESHEEDFAESFAAYVLNEAGQSQTSVVAEKIKFFDQFPDFVRARSNIKARLGR